MNHKRLRRLYCAEGLQVRPRKKRRVRFARGHVSPAPTKLNEEWGLDFMEEYLMTKREIRLLTIEDRFSREGLALDPDFSLTSRRVIRTLDDIAELRGYPARLRVDNGPENVAGAMLQWSIDHNVLLHFIDPGKPAQNAWIESFNARVRDEFLNVQYFQTLPHLRDGADAWLVDYKWDEQAGHLIRDAATLPSRLNCRKVTGPWRIVSHSQGSAKIPLSSRPWASTLAIDEATIA